MKRDLELAFDVGHSSIGWAVLQTNPEVEIKGCGALIFGPDDCLASVRRQKRQMRRHVRATKKRIELLERTLLLMGAFKSKEQVAAKHQTPKAVDGKWDRSTGGHPAPWLLAARVLESEGAPEFLLEWPELFDVLRWYAHNRGYDSRPPWITGFDSDLDLASTNLDGDEKKDAGDGETESEQEETTRRLKQGVALMKEAPQTETMAETVCKILYAELFPKDQPKTPECLNEIILNPKLSEHYHKMARYKGEKAAAFPRANVIAEVQRILVYHRDRKKLRGCDDGFIKALIHDWRVLPDEWKAKCGEKDKTKIWLPRRYGVDIPGKGRRYGGILFGQQIPRFHNRIISRCPITYATVLRQQLSSGEPYPKAENTARIAAKVPAKMCKEFLQYRWTVGFLANVRVGNAKGELFRVLSKKERQFINAQMQQQGFLDKKQLEDLVKEGAHCSFSNVADVFEVTPESEEALCVDPAKKYVATNELARAFWPVIGPLQKRVLGQLRRGRRITLRFIRQQLASPRYGASTQQFDVALQNHADFLYRKALEKAKEKNRRKKTVEKALTVDQLLSMSLAANYPSGRGPYHRKILQEATKQVLDGLDPRKKKLTPQLPPDQAARAEKKEIDGILVETDDMVRLRLGLQLDGISDEQIYEAWKERWLKRRDRRGKYHNRQLYQERGDVFAHDVWKAGESERWLAAQTNNHMVRHRLLMLERLTQDILSDYPDFIVTRVSLEVARDLLAFSGVTKKQLGSDDKGVMGSIKAQHYRVKECLEKMLGDTKYANDITGALIWKAKVADDLGWRCPYTGEQITPIGLVEGIFDVDHIIPKSTRLTDAMEAVVITYKEINARKGARTSWQFVHDEQGKYLLGQHNKPIRKLEDYEKFVKALRTHRSRSAGKDDGEGDNIGSIEINPMYLPGTKKKHPDYIRRKKRKSYLKVKSCDKDRSSFTSRDLTVTSHINRLAQQALRRILPKLGPEGFVSIPGVVTAAFRDARGWRLMDCLRHERVCGDAVTEKRKFRDKETDEVTEKEVLVLKNKLRDITNLHHAVDACALALIGSLIPKNGALWELIALGELTIEEKKNYESLREQFRRGRLANGEIVRQIDLDDLLDLSEIQPGSKKRYADPDRKWRLMPRETYEARRRMNAIKDSMIAELAKKNVVHHIPKDRSGLSVKETTWRVVRDLRDRETLMKILRRVCAWRDEKNVDRMANEFLNRVKSVTLKPDEIWIMRYIRRDTTPKPKKPTKCVAENEKFFIAYDIVSKDKLHGLTPDGDITKAKLVKQSGAFLLEENFAAALLRYATDPKDRVQVIRWRKINKEIARLWWLNQRKPLELIRKYSLVTLDGERRLVLGIDDAENGALFKLAEVDAVRRKDGPKNYRPVVIKAKSIDRIRLIQMSPTGRRCASRAVKT